MPVSGRPPASRAAACSRRSADLRQERVAGRRPAGGGTRSRTRSRFGTMLSAVPPRIDAGVHGRVAARRSRGRTGRVAASARAMPREVATISRRDLDRVDALRAPARNGIRGRARAQRQLRLPLWRDDQLHAGRLADDAAGGLDRALPRARRSAGARRCSRPPRRTRTRNAAAS